LCPILGAIVITITLHPLGCFIGVSDRGGWGRGLHSRRWLNFGIGGVLLTHLHFFIGVTEYDDLAVVGWPKNTMVEVAKEPPGEILILRGVGEDIFLIQRKIHHQDPLKGSALLKEK
jgi:hypothetical protein